MNSFWGKKHSCYRYFNWVIGFESPRWHLWHLEGTTNSFWGERNILVLVILNIRVI